jgi:hypothetical protein
VREQHQLDRLVGDGANRCEQRLSMRVGRAGVDGDDAAVADDEAGIADAAEVLVVGGAAAAGQQLDAVGDSDGARCVAADAGAASQQPEHDGVEQQGAHR